MPSKSIFEFVINSISARTLIHDDGFAVTAAEPWIRSKVEIIQQYVSAFVANLAGKVDDITLVDLYTGNGFYSLGSNRDIFAGSALAIMKQELPINRYVLCERDPEQFKTLKIRTNRYFRGKNIILLEGRPEELIEKFRMYIPGSKGEFKSAVLCLCDPFSMEISFDTLARLIDLDFSFLIPYTLMLNDRINYKHYLNEDRSKLIRFLGGNREVDRLEQSVVSNPQFYKRLVQIHQSNLLEAGLNGSTSVYKLDSGLMEMPWYYVGFYSGQIPTRIIRNDVESGMQVQYDLFGK